MGRLFHEIKGNPILEIRMGKYCPATTPMPRSGSPLDSETVWTGELWLKTNLLNWQNQENSIFFLEKKYIF